MKRHHQAVSVKSPNKLGNESGHFQQLNPPYHSVPLGVSSRVLDG
jgi:hypothetical protein